MTDTQILTLIIGVTFPVVGLMGTIAAIMHFNKRIDNLRDDLRTRMSEFQASIEKRIEHMGLLLKLHEAEHHKR